MADKTVFIVHTNRLTADVLIPLFEELAPGVRVRNIIDDSILPEVIAHGGLTQSVRERMRTYFGIADSLGADLIFNQCSSVGEAADEAAHLVRTRVIKTDEAMAQAACAAGKRIGVIATLKTTLGPTSRLVSKTAQTMGQEAEVVEHLCEGAFDRLVSGDRAGHDALVIAGIRELAERVDVVACAQGSMAALLDQLGETRIPVLTSPRSGVQMAADFLATLP